MTATQKAAEKEGRATPQDKPMTRGEAVKKLDGLIGTPAPIDEAIALRKVVAIHGTDDDAPLSPELQAAVEDVEQRTKDSDKKK